jgi:hypothetical protein
MAFVTQPRGLLLWSDYRQFVRRHRAWIGACMGLGLMVGYVWSLGQPTTYSATASVFLVPVPKYVTPSTTELVPPEVSIDTDAQLLNSPEVLRTVADVTGADADAVSDDLSVTASPNTHVLHVTVAAGSADDAADAANAAVAALVEVRRNVLGALRISQLQQLRLLITDREDQLRQEQAKGMVIPANDDMFTQILDLQSGLQTLEEARRQPAEVVSPAVAPRHADYANTEVPLVSGVMVGLICGCLLGAARDRSGPAARRLASPPFSPYPSGDRPDVAIGHEDYHHAV